MARNWDEPNTIGALERRLQERAPDNTAPIPIAASKQVIDGQMLWVVDVHVRIPRVTEYEVTGEDATLPGALRRVYLAMNAEDRMRWQAAQANAQFGIRV